jgi:phage shock protein C
MDCTFESSDKSKTESSIKLNNNKIMERKLQRNTLDKKLAGVCSGLAEYFDIDVTLIRVAFIMAVVAGFSGILAYIILWIIVPVKPVIPGSYNRQYTADYRVYNENPQGTSR